MIGSIIIYLSNFLVSISNHVFGNTVASAASQYYRGNFEPTGAMHALLIRLVMAGAGLALALMAVRFAAKTAGVVAFARVSGITWRKGLLPLRF